MTATNRTQAVSGELTFDSVPELFRQSEAWFVGDGGLVIDLARVTRVDSAGLALMIEWLRRARSAGRALSFTNVPAQVQTLIRINGLTDALLPNSR